MSFPPPDPSRPARSDLPPPGAAPFPPPDEPIGDEPDPTAPVEPTIGAASDPHEDPRPDDADVAPADHGDAEIEPPDEPIGGDAEEPDEPGPSAADTPDVLTPDEVIGDRAGDEASDPPVERVPPSAPVMQPASTLPAATTSRALVPIPRVEEDPAPRRGLAKRWSLPAWAWLALGTAVVAAGVAAIITRPDDDTKEVATLQAEVASKEAEIVQVQADARQEAFNDVQEVRDEAEQQLSAAADAREQAEEAADLSDARYAELVEYQIGVAQAAANEAACRAGDTAGYKQEAKPDPAKFAPGAVAELPGDTRAAVLAQLDTAAIKAQVDECFENGSNRYLAQTTTTTTTTAPPPPPAVDPNAPPAG